MKLFIPILMFLLILSSCEPIPTYSPEGLRKLSQKEILERTKNRDTPNPALVIYKNNRGEQLSMDSLRNIPNLQEFAFDVYVDEKGEPIEIVYRAASEADKQFLLKVQQTAAEGPTIDFINIDCSLTQQVLQEVFDRDQAMRKEGQTIDPVIDRKNLQTVVSLIEQCGMPSMDEIGELPMYGIVVALQHSQSKYLAQYYPLLKKELGVMPIIEDRILMQAGKPQLYGTQIKNGQLYELADPGTVDQRRKAVGLGPLREYLNRFDISFTVPQSTSRSPVYISRDAGKNWEPAGIGFPSDTEASFILPFGESLVLATDNKGLFIGPKDQGEWKQISQILPTQKITALAVYGNEVFIGLFRQGLHAYSSSAGYWYDFNSNLPDLSVQAILATENQLLVGTDSGIYLYNKSEKSWSHVCEGQQIISIQQQDNLLFAGSSTGILMSEDNGAHWAMVHTNGALHGLTVIGSQIFALYISGDLYLSEDAGKNWIESEYTPRQGSYIYEIVQAGGLLLFSNNYGVYQSEDGGLTWQLTYPNERYAILDFLNTGDVIYAATRGWNESRARHRQE